MLIIIDDLLDAETVAHFRQQLATAIWIDGRATAGTLSGLVKSNEQVDDACATGRALRAQLLHVVNAHPRVISAALPHRIYPPRFNRYRDGGHFGIHVDGSLMRHADEPALLRTDVSATVFLSEPDEYDGGELTIETDFGAQAVKLPAGSMVLYPSSSLHQVTPVTRGVRIAAFFWIQSLIRDPGDRGLLFDLDQTIQQLRLDLPGDDLRIVALTGSYHNLLRRWAGG
jgi:PKHD-type hydroxylase